MYKVCRWVIVLVLGGGAVETPAIYIQPFPTLCLFLASTSCMCATPHSTLCMCAHPQQHIMRVCRSSTLIVRVCQSLTLIVHVCSSLAVTASTFSVQGPEDTCGKWRRTQRGMRRGTRRETRLVTRWGTWWELGGELDVARTNRHDGTDQAGTCLQRTTIGRRLRKVDYDRLPKYPPAMPSSAR